MTALRSRVSDKESGVTRATTTSSLSRCCRGRAAARRYDHGGDSQTLRLSCALAIMMMMTRTMDDDVLAGEIGRREARSSLIKAALPRVLLPGTRVMVMNDKYTVLLCSRHQSIGGRHRRPDLQLNANCNY